MVKSRQWLCSVLVVGLGCMAASKLQARTFLYLSLASENGLAVYQVNDQTGKLKYLRLHDLGTDPGPISVSPDQRTIYVSLRNAGKLAAFRVRAKDGSLEHLSTVVAEPDPAYHWPDRTKRFLISAYYQAGKVALHRLDTRGAIIAEGARWYTTARNAHGIAVNRGNQRVYVSHTGANAIYQFDFDANAGKLKPSATPVIRTGPQTGPRHISLHPSKPFAYADNEQGNSITFFRVVKGNLEPVQTLSTVPSDWDKGGACARLEMSPDGAYVYVANRGHQSIAAFRIDQQSGRMTTLGQTPTEANPRSFTIHSNGRFLYAAGQDTDRMAIFSRDKQGRLKRLDTIATGKRPWWLTLVTAADSK